MLHTYQVPKALLCVVDTLVLTDWKVLRLSIYSK